MSLRREKLPDQPMAGYLLETQALTDAERREIELIKRERAKSGHETVEELEARITASADPATMAALDDPNQLAYADVPIKRIEVSTDCWDTPTPCPNKVARTATSIDGDEWTTEIAQLDCERRSCPVCGPLWAETWAMNVHHNFADAEAVTVIEIKDTQWEAVRKAITRNRCEDDRYVRIPTNEGRSLVVTSTPITQGKGTAAPIAILEAEQALKEVHQRASIDERRVSTSRNFEKPAQVRRPPGEAQQDIIYGQLTKIDTARLSEELAAITEGTGTDLVTLIRDRDEDPTQANRWRITGPPLAMQLMLARAGHRTDAEIEAERAERRHKRAFDDEQRRTEQRRRLSTRAAA